MTTHPNPWQEPRGSQTAYVPESVGERPYRDAMARLAGGVALITTRDPVGRDCGITVTAFSAVSLDPPLALVCLRREGFIHDAVIVSDGWAFTMLAADQVDLARYAARHHRPGDPDNFSPWAHRRGKLVDALVFTGGVAAIECVPHQIVDSGDHTIVIGRVVAAANDMTGTDPLVYVDRDYHRLAP